MTEIATCGTCRHLITERDGWHGQLSPISGPEGETEAEHDERSRILNAPFGECAKVGLETDEVYLSDTEPTLAYVQDGSHYVATLYVTKEFGCILHTPIAPREDQS